MLDLIQSRRLPAGQLKIFEHTRRATNRITTISAGATQTLDNIWKGVSPDKCADYQSTIGLSVHGFVLTFSNSSSDTVQLTSRSSRSNSFAS